MRIIVKEFIACFKESPWEVTKLVLHVVIVFGFGIGMLVIASMLN